MLSTTDQVYQLTIDNLERNKRILPQQSEFIQLSLLRQFQQKEYSILAVKKEILTIRKQRNQITQDDYQRETALINSRQKELVYDDVMAEMMQDYLSSHELLNKKLQLFNTQVLLKSPWLNHDYQAIMRNELAKLIKEVGHLDDNVLKETIINKERELQRLLRNYWISIAMLLTPTMHSSAPIHALPTELMLHIASYLPPSAFCDKDYQTLQDCFAFVVNSNADGQQAKAQKMQLIESTTASPRFQWRFFAENLKRKRDDDTGQSNDNEHNAKLLKLS